MDKEIIVNYYNINGLDYIILKETDYNNRHYVYLANENDPSDMMVRRVNGTILEALDSEEELSEVLKLLIK